jgi:L-proline---[L-prolyl-carrier protein] ligase
VRLDQLVARAAQAHGDRDAVAMEGHTLSWGALDALANQVARALDMLGVRAGDRVGLWLPKSPEAVAALYGIMRAGAAYVPVDPGAPPARLAWIARDCQLAALVTRGDRVAEVDRALDGLPSLRGTILTDVAGPASAAGAPTVTWHEIRHAATATPGLPAAGEDHAYILYTSGSTGEPKGVVHTHASAMAFVEWAARTFGISPADRLANHAPFHFDLSTFDLFATAFAGAAMYPVPARLLPFPAAVARSWAEQRLTVWYATPSSLVLMLTRGSLATLDLSALRVLLFAGEVFPAKYLRELMRLVPHARLANLYGPTETNVCTWHEVTGPPDGDQPLPIGVPCCGDAAWVLDPSLAPVPEGESGELWITGPTVMQGYWNDAARTARSLRALAVAGGANGYGTGDMVRRRPDGALEFLGRRDHQVKTRGYRVELGEIEAALLAHPAVDEAVVIAVPDEEITHRLKAIVVVTAGPAVDAQALKQHCATTLPRYMVPETIEFRAALPRTSSGKVDRRALERVES